MSVQMDNEYSQICARTNVKPQLSTPVTQYTLNEPKYAHFQENTTLVR